MHTKNKHQLEAVQHRAARFVTGNFRLTSSVTEMLQLLDWISSEQRQEISLCYYKILHNAVSIPSHHIPNLRSRSHSQRFQ